MVTVAIVSATLTKNIVKAKTKAWPFPLWPWLVTVALLLLMLDVALRRIDFSLHLFWMKARTT